MAKLYIHAPIKQLVSDFELHLKQDTSKQSNEEVKTALSALIISPVDGSKSFRQLLAPFLKKLSKKFRSLLKAADITSKATWTWDENLVIVLESLDEFLHLKWKVRFFAEEGKESSEVDDFKTQLYALAISEDLFVSFELLTLPEENTFDLNRQEEKVELHDEDDGGELVVEEISRDNTAEDKELERIKKEENDKKFEEEFATMKEKIEKDADMIKQVFSVGMHKNAMELSELLLNDLKEIKPNTREHMIYLTGKNIEISTVLAMVHLKNKRAEKAKSILSALLPTAKRGPVEAYIDLLLILGDAEYELEDLEEAMKAYSQALSVKKKFTPREKMILNSRRAKTAIKFELEDAIGYVNMTGDEGLKYMKYVKDNTEPGNELHSTACHSIADIMYRRGQVGNAAHICLVALISDAENIELQKQFVTLLQAHDKLVDAMLEMIETMDNPEAAARKKKKKDNEQSESEPEVPLTPEQLKKAISTASSLHFLGIVLKNHSAMTQAEKFLRHACTMTQYKAVEYIKSYMDFLEDMRDFSTAVTTALNFFHTCPEEGISITIPPDAQSEELSTVLEKLGEHQIYKQMIEKDEEGNVIFSLKNALFNKWHEAANSALGSEDAQFTLNFSRCFKKDANVELSNIEVEEREEEKESETEKEDTEVEKEAAEVENKDEKEKEENEKKDEGEDDEKEPKPKRMIFFSLLSVDGEKNVLSEFVEVIVKSNLFQSKELEKNKAKHLSLFFNCIGALLQILPPPQTNYGRAQGKEVIGEVLNLIALLEPFRGMRKGSMTPEEEPYTSVIKALPAVIESRKKAMEKLLDSDTFNFFTLEQEEQKKIYGRSLSFTQAFDDKVKNIYVFGPDIQHLAWQVFTKDDEDAKVFQMLPIHVKQCRILQLSYESDFHTKFVFNAGAASIKKHHGKWVDRQKFLTANKVKQARSEEEISALQTRKPSVVFIFGQADIALDIFWGYETGKYTSIEEACNTVIDCYTEVLENTAKKYGFSIFVHPLLSNGDSKAFQQIEKLFNDKLATKITQLKKKMPDLSLLDLSAFVETDEHGDYLKEEYQMKGLTIHPMYLEGIKEQLLK